MAFGFGAAQNAHGTAVASGIQFADNMELKQKRIDTIQHDLKEMEEKRNSYQTTLLCTTLSERRKTTLHLQMTKLNSKSEKNSATLHAEALATRE
jgi:hypothetical protein